MTHNSPAVYLVWSVLVGALFCFLITHLWAFDRFRCLKWSSTGGNGTFKRVMTYSYLTSIPLLLIFAVGFTFVKYTEGYIDAKTLIGVSPEVRAMGIIPKPTQLWTKAHQDLILPFYLCFSIAWALEIVSHLEELCFWLFLIHSSDSHSAWFRSPHFISWALGSCVALGGLPSITIYLRDNVELSEAWTFLAGSVGSLALTLLFLPVLAMFPRFLRKVRDEGVEPAVMVRLTKFHSLNISRVIFRFIFVVPLLVVAIDGVRPHSEHVINKNYFLTDLLAMLAGLGCVVSSMITLLIFFPRSYEQEAGYRFRERPMTEIWANEDEKDMARTKALPSSHLDFKDGFETRSFQSEADPYTHRPSPSLPVMPQNYYPGSRFDDDSSVYPPTLVNADGDRTPTSHPYKANVYGGQARRGSQQVGASPMDPRDHPFIFPPADRRGSMPPPRPRKNSARRRTVWEMVDMDEDDGNARNAAAGRLEEGGRPRTSLHPIVANFTSPINVFDAQANVLPGRAI